jgi:hypothetical protein
MKKIKEIKIVSDKRKSAIVRITANALKNNLTLYIIRYILDMYISKEVGCGTLVQGTLVQGTLVPNPPLARNCDREDLVV